MASKLLNVQVVNQAQFFHHACFSIEQGENCLVIGSSGVGKTDLIFQACAATNVLCIYWNLSVGERPDLQGVPAVSPDGLIATYAAPLSIPFIDTRFYQQKEAIKKALGFQNEGSKERAYLESRLRQIEQYDKMVALQGAMDYINNGAIKNNFQKQIKELQTAIKDLNLKEAVILFDEVDKAPQEVQQPLLELLLYRRINGRPLYIKSALLTSNLPDENVYGEALNHAITNRGQVFEIDPSFEAWKVWAMDKVHPIILGFLCRSEHQAYFFRRGTKQIYNYAYETPRAWTQASKLLTAYEAIEKEHPVPNSKEFKTQLIASKVGVEAAEKLSVWVDYYKEFDPIVDKVFEGGTIDLDKLEDDKLFVFGISLSAKFNYWARANGTPIKEIHEKAKHVYTLINKMPMELQIAALRSTCDVELFHQKGLDNLPETAKIWEEINQLINDANSA
jgi:hypothetical protein